jgi:hypothetical protein
MSPRRTRPIWYQLATPEERSKIDDLDRSIADLRRARQVLVNRAKLRTHVWVQRRVAPVTGARRKPVASYRHTRSDVRRSKH